MRLSRLTWAPPLARMSSARVLQLQSEFREDPQGGRLDPFERLLARQIERRQRAAAERPRGLLQAFAVKPRLALGTEAAVAGCHQGLSGERFMGVPSLLAAWFEIGKRKSGPRGQARSSGFTQLAPDSTPPSTTIAWPVM